MIKGFTSGFDAVRGGLRSPAADDSLAKLRATGTEWLCLAFIVYQKTYASTEIFFDYRDTPADRDITHAVRQAKSLGMKVCLKPVINSRDGVWRAEIDFPDPDDSGRDIYWDEWFSYYTAFIRHYAELAEETGCDMLCIGCEMLGTERKEQHWRALIKTVRPLYGGPLMYNTNHGNESGANWYDAVDYIGVSAYYPVAWASSERSERPAPDEEAMYQNWLAKKPHLQALSERWNKPVIFAEVGCRSASGCAAMPWDFLHPDLPFDEAEQAAFYRSCLRAFWGEPWFAGFFWWHWATELYDISEAKTNKDFDIYGKEAEQVIREWYGKVDFSEITACGECCVGCRKKFQGACGGCIETGGHCEEWAQSEGCPIYLCAKEHEVSFCGLCEAFPCQKLTETVTWNPKVTEHLSELKRKHDKQINGD